MILCRLRLHHWREVKYRITSGLQGDGRECRRCARFEVWLISGYVHRPALYDHPREYPR